MLFSWAVERNLMRRHINDPAEFIGADKFLRAGNGLSDGKNECSTVGIAAAAGVPIIIGNGSEARVFLRKTLEGGIDGLLFRADKADRNLALLKCKDLRSQHRGIGDADQLELLVPHIGTGNNKEPV